MCLTFANYVNPLNPDLPLWICTPALASQRPHRHRLDGAVRSRSDTFEFAEYRPHKSVQSIFDCLVYIVTISIRSRVSNIRYAEIIVQKLITLLKETESTNENIAAVVDKFPKLRTTTRVSINDCHWLAQEDE